MTDFHFYDLRQRLFSTCYDQRRGQGNLNSWRYEDRSPIRTQPLAQLEGYQHARQLLIPSPSATE